MARDKYNNGGVTSHKNIGKLNTSAWAGGNTDNSYYGGRVSTGNKNIGVGYSQTHGRNTPLDKNTGAVSGPSSKNTSQTFDAQLRAGRNKLNFTQTLNETSNKWGNFENKQKNISVSRDVGKRGQVTIDSKGASYEHRTKGGTKFKAGINSRNGGGGFLSISKLFK